MKITAVFLSKKKHNDSKWLVDKIKIIFDEPQFAIAPGQSCVIYIDDVVIAGGIISK